MSPARVLVRLRQLVTGPGLPVVGSVAAGQPILAEENIEEYMQVPSAAGGADGGYILRVRGESMKDIGMMEGDYVVVRPQETANDGEDALQPVARRRLGAEQQLHRLARVAALLQISGGAGYPGCDRGRRVGCASNELSDRQNLTAAQVEADQST